MSKHDLNLIENVNCYNVFILTREKSISTIFGKDFRNMLPREKCLVTENDLCISPALYFILMFSTLLSKGGTSRPCWRRTHPATVGRKSPTESE